MFIARLSIDARFGYKQKVIDQMKQWDKEIGSQIGWTGENIRTLSGSVGARESLMQREMAVASLAELEAGFQKLAAVEGQTEWSRELEKYIVSGSNVWEILRVIET